MVLVALQIVTLGQNLFIVIGAGELSIARNKRSNSTLFIIA